MFNETALFSELRSTIFGGRISQVQVDSVKAILSEIEEQNVRNLNMVAYILATTWHEARLRPVREGFAETDEEARKVVRHRPYGKPVGRHVYYGRGFVQLTWYDNYKKWGIENTPDKALEPAFAAKVLVTGMLKGTYNKGGTGPGLAHYLDRPTPDWQNARRTVNITDRWELIKGYALTIKRALEVAQALYSPGVNAESKSDRISTGKSPVKSTTNWSAIITSLTGAMSTVVGLGREQPLLAAFIVVVLAAGAFWIIRERGIKAEEFGI